MRILTTRRHETMGRLAEELRVSIRTIRSDITMLTVDYPLETQRGNGGCVKVADWYHPHRNILSSEQQSVTASTAVQCGARKRHQLCEILDTVKSKHLRLVIMNSIISQFAP